MAQLLQELHALPLPNAVQRHSTSSNTELQKQTNLIPPTAPTHLSTIAQAHSPARLGG